MRSYVSLSPLTLIKILRPLLISPRLQRHLTDCAAYEVLDRAFAPWLPPLLKRHVLGFTPRPKFTSRPEKLAHLVGKTVH